MREVYRIPARFVCCAVVAWLALPPAGGAQPGGTPGTTEGGPAVAKVSGHLLEARSRLERGLPLAGEQRGPLRIEPFVSTRRPRVDVRLSELDPVLLERLRAAGLEVLSSSERWAMVHGRLDLDRLDEVAAFPEVATIDPFYGARLWTGSTASQGDASMKSDLARTTFGVDGSGVTVGLMSDSFHNGLGGSESGGPCACASPGSTCSNVVTGMANQATGDLPPSVPILLDLGGGGSDEGAALGEIVADVAPGADQMFRTAFVSEADFADGIDGLANCGADVIVDDVFYLAEPMFQDGPVAQAARAAVDGGIAFFSAAGNQATFGVDDLFVDSGPTDDGFPKPAPGDPPSGSNLHDFGPGAGLAGLGTADNFAAVTIPEDCGVTFILQWAEPWSGVLGPGASSDLDLYLCTAPSAASCGLDLGFGPLRSATNQGCGTGLPGPSGNPIEGFGISVSGGSGTIWVAVEHVCGDEDVEFRIATFPSGPGCGFPGAYDFEDGGAGETAIYVDPQIYGHAAADGVVAVAAIFYDDFDTGTFAVEPFSSLGGNLPFYFDGSGDPLPLAPGGPSALLGGAAPETRFKPEITGPDGGNSTFFGDPDINFPPDGFPNFFGTSASAPHAAAVAALMKELGNLTPSGLLQVIEQSAFDLELPGLDDLSGFGMIDAFGGVGTTVPITPAPGDCFIDELELEGKPNTGTQTFRACNSLKLSKGDFSDVIGIADEIIFADGFESGDTSAWSSSSP